MVTTALVLMTVQEDCCEVRINRCSKPQQVLPALESSMVLLVLALG